MKLTLRDLFWAVLVVALALGWFVDHSRQRRLRVEQTTAYQKIVVDVSKIYVQSVREEVAAQLRSRGIEVAEADIVVDEWSWVFVD